MTKETCQYNQYDLSRSRARDAITSVAQNRTLESAQLSVKVQPGRDKLAPPSATTISLRAPNSPGEVGAVRSLERLLGAGDIQLSLLEEIRKLVKEEGK